MSDDLEDLIAEAIADSMDMDWTSRDGARHVAGALAIAGLVAPDTHPNATDYRNRAARAEAELAEVRAEVERLTKWRPIETAPDDDRFIAAIEVHHKNGGHWWEYHVVWLDDETGDIHTDCEQGWGISDYSHWLALPDAPYPLSEARAALNGGRHD